MIPKPASLLLYLITDRRMPRRKSHDKEADPLTELARRAAAAGVDMIQVREKDLPPRDLFSLTKEIAEAARPYGARVLVNDRADISAALGVGVHLTTRSMRVGVVRSAFGPDMLIGVSTHSLEEAVAAERGGADFIVFGPVFETESKRAYGPPVGLDALREAANALSIPVLALGGIKRENYRKAVDHGAAGIAAISLFAEAEDLADLVRQIKEGVTSEP